MPVDRQRRVQQLLAAALSLYGLVLASHPLDEADTFFQLSMGRAVLRAGSRVVPEPTAFADFTAPAVAFEWLWSVLSYAVFVLGGYSLLTWLGCILSALACCSAVLLTQRTRAEGVSVWWLGLISALAVCCIMCRVAVRPELGSLCALPWFVLGALAYARQPPDRRLLLGAALTLACVAWAQMHASFVLCPVIFLVCVARRDALARRRELRTDGVVLLLLLAAQLTGPFGVHLGERIFGHAAGDAPRYILDMARPTWASLDPFATPNTAAYFAVLAIGSAGMLIERRWYVRELGLLLLGAALFATANRFIAEAALLAVPFANLGARGLSRHFQGSLWLRLTGAAAAVSLLGLTAAQMQRLHGPIGRWSVEEHSLALHAATALQQDGLPKDTAVLTDYNSSAVVGFVGADHMRTFVDGRTPSYFDATDFAVAREISRDKIALHNALERYGARAAVFRRDSEACLHLSDEPGWTIALVEPLYTTFVKGAPDSLRRLRPCGISYFTRDDCSEALNADIARVRAAGAREFASFLEAARSLRCAGDAKSALTSLHALAPFALAFQPYYDRVAIEAELGSSDFHAAVRHMLSAIDRRDFGVVGLLQLEAAGGLPLEAARQVLGAYIDDAGDEAEIGVRAALAEICARLGDQECARFQATRAAVRGRSTAALSWLAQQHHDERVRRDAQRWLDVLGQASAAREPGAAGPTPAARR